jgi:hypothetical protein
LPSPTIDGGASRCVRTLRCLVVAAVLAASVWVGGLSPLHVLANANCYEVLGPNHFNHLIGYDGYSRPPASWDETPEGTSAYILTRNAALCPNEAPPINVSTTWVMLEDNGKRDHYIQAGYQSYFNCMRFFVEWNLGGYNNQTTHYGDCATQGVAYTYHVEYVGHSGPYPPCCGSMQMQAGTLYDAANFDPWHQNWSMQPLFMAETVDYADDVPGTVGMTADHTAMGIQSVATGTLRSVPCYLSKVADTSRYHSTASGCDHIWFWTNPL